jgi:hypothetical protein
LSSASLPGEAAIPLTAVTFPAILAWLAWIISLLFFWIIQSRRAEKQRSGVDSSSSPTIILFG